MKIWLFLASLLVAGSLSVAQFSAEEYYEVESLDDLEDELGEIISSTFEEELIYFDEEVYSEDDSGEDYSYEDDDSSSSSEESDESSEESDESSEESDESSEESDESSEEGGRRRNVKKQLRNVMRYMHNHDVDDVRDVPRRVIGRRGKVYRRIVRVYERKESKDKLEPGDRFSGFCAHLESKAPRPRVLQSLPKSIKEEYVSMFYASKEQLSECCELDGEESEMCFEDAYDQKMDKLCALQWQLEDQTEVRNNSVFMRMLNRRQRCCQILEPSDRRECFKEEGRQARRRNRRDVDQDDEADWESLTPQRKVDRVCTRLGERGEEIMSARREKLEGRSRRMHRVDNMEQHLEGMMQCCEQEGQSRYECVDSMKRTRLSEICNVSPSESENRGQRGQKASAIRERCCSLQGEERDSCLDEIVREHLAMKRERNQGQRRQERKQARQEKKAARDEEGSEEEEEGERGGRRAQKQAKKQAKAAKAATRQQKKERKQERRRLRVVMEEERLAEDGQEGARARRSIDEVDGEVMTRKNPGRNRKGGRAGERRQRGERKAAEKEECCQAGTAFGETAEVEGPRDGKAMTQIKAMCQASAQEAAPYADNRKCLGIYKKCCVRGVYGFTDDDDDMSMGGRQRGGRGGGEGRRRRVRVEIEEDVDEVSDETVEELLERAEVMMADARF